LIPYVFTIFAYWKIYFKLHELDDNMQLSHNTSGTTSTRSKEKRRKSLTSFLIVGSYLICYLPVVIIRSLKLDENYLVVSLYIRPWCNTLLFSSFSLHALLYGWRSTKRFFLQTKLAWMARLSRVHVAED
jgi:hypothetical protein